MRERFRDFARPITEEPLPRVDVLVVNSRTDTTWLDAATASVEQQSYPNTGLWVIGNTDHALTLGQGWNIGVQASTADLVLLLREEDMLTADLVDTLVTFWHAGRRSTPSLVHVTNLITVLDERTGRMGAAPLAHAGMFLRSMLVEQPFSSELGHEAPHRMLEKLSQASIDPITFGVAHHHGYIWRNHDFRIDRLQVNG